MNKSNRKYRILYRNTARSGWLLWSQTEFEEAFLNIGAPIPDLAIGESAKYDDLDTWVRVE